jgi:tyrosinase
MAANPSETVPEDAPWYATEFLFFTEDGNEVRMTGKQIIDTVCQLDYRYEDDDPDTVCAPPEALGTPVVSPPPVTRQPTEVAEIKRETELGPDLVTVPIDLGAEAAEALAPTAATPEAVGPEPRVVLTLQGVRGTGVTGVSNAVYLNLPDGQEPDPSGPYFVGLISLFGRQPENLDDEHAAPVQSFDITENVRTLQEQGEQPQQLVLTFVPFEYAAAVGAEATPEAEAAQGPWITIDGYSIAVQ